MAAVIRQPASIGQSPAHVEYPERHQSLDIAKYSSLIQYSGRYDDVEYQYRHVILPKELAKYLSKDRTATVGEYSAIGITMSPGWVNYELIPHQRGNKHIMVFRRPRALGDKYPVRQMTNDTATPAKPPHKKRKSSKNVVSNDAETLLSTEVTQSPPGTESSQNVVNNDETLQAEVQE